MVGVWNHVHLVMLLSTRIELTNLFFIGGIDFTLVSHFELFIDAKVVLVENIIITVALFCSSVNTKRHLRRNVDAVVLHCLNLVGKLQKRVTSIGLELFPGKPVTAASATLAAHFEAEHGLRLGRDSATLLVFNDRINLMVCVVYLE